mgnify:CR=1 FL=1
MIKLEDLVIGEVYYQQEEDTGFITRFGGIGCDKDTYISITDINNPDNDSENSFDIDGETPGDDGHFKTLRLASLEEVLWLEACEKKGDYVPKSKIKVKKLTKKQYSKINDLMKEFDEL